MVGTKGALGVEAALTPEALTPEAFASTPEALASTPEALVDAART